MDKRIHSFARLMVIYLFPSQSTYSIFCSSHHIWEHHSILKIQLAIFQVFGLESFDGSHVLLLYKEVYTHRHLDGDLIKSVSI